MVNGVLRFWTVRHMMWLRWVWYMVWLGIMWNFVWCWIAVRYCVGFQMWLIRIIFMVIFVEVEMKLEVLLWIFCKYNN